jgi:phage shock protein PspC (stress-responsive transcriptional regulator)
MSLLSSKSDLLQEVADKINIDGLREIHAADSRLVRVAWVIVVVGSILMGSFYSYKVAAEYMNNNMATKVWFSFGNLFARYI